MVNDNNYTSYEVIADKANKLINQKDLFFILKKRDGVFLIGRVFDFSSVKDFFGFSPETCFEFDSRRNTWSPLDGHSGWSFNPTYGGGSFNEKFISETGLAFTMIVMNDGYRMVIEFYDELDLLKKRIKKINVLENSKLPLL